MMKQYLLLLLTSLLLFTSSISAEQPGPVVIDSVRIGKALRGDARKIWKVFGGQAIQVSLVVCGNAKERIDIRADLFQTGSGNIGAPIKKDIPVASDLDFLRREQYQIAFPLQLPIVEQASDFYLRCHFRSASGEKWQALGSVNIRIYPDDILRPVQAFAERNRIYLYGEGSILKSFLKDKDIRFEDRKDSFPKAENNPGLILAEYIDKDWFAIPKELASNQAVVVFYPPPDNLPRTIVKQAGKGILIEVKMSLLDDLATNPEAQEFFGEIIDLALNHLAAATN
jgi:hypothetical protein